MVPAVPVVSFRGFVPVFLVLVQARPLAGRKAYVNERSQS